MLATNSEGKTVCVILTHCGMNIFHTKIANEFSSVEIYSFCYTPKSLIAYKQALLRQWLGAK